LHSDLLSEFLTLHQQQQRACCKWLRCNGLNAIWRLKNPADFCPDFLCPIGFFESCPVSESDTMSCEKTRISVSIILCRLDEQNNLYPREVRQRKIAIFAEIGNETEKKSLNLWKNRY